MTLPDLALDVMGWGGSALLVLSLLQARVLRFRAVNLVASLLLAVFNFFLAVWPMVVVNAILAGINLWFLVTLVRQRHDMTRFQVLRVHAADAYLAHVLRNHRADIKRFQPDFSGPGPDSVVYLVQQGDETVGVVVLRVVGDTAQVELDYVTPPYRDFSPGEFVWRHSDLLRQLEVERVVTAPGMRGAYYDRLGFARSGDSWVLELTP